MQPHDTPINTNRIEITGPLYLKPSAPAGDERGKPQETPSTPQKEAEKTQDGPQSPGTPSNSGGDSPPPQPSTPSPEHLRTSQSHISISGNNEQSKDLTGLPLGWTIKMSKSRQLHYYCHKATERTTWRAPNGTDKELLQAYLWAHWDDFDPVTAKEG